MCTCSSVELAMLHMAMLYLSMLHLAVIQAMFCRLCYIQLCYTWLCCTRLCYTWLCCTCYVVLAVLSCCPGWCCFFVFIFLGICRPISNLSWRKRSSHLRFELIICFVDSYSYINKLTLLMTNDLKKWHMHKVFLIFIVFEVFVWECHATCSI